MIRQKTYSYENRQSLGFCTINSLCLLLCKNNKNEKLWQFSAMKWSIWIFVPNNKKSVISVSDKFFIHACIWKKCMNLPVVCKKYMAVIKLVYMKYTKEQKDVFPRVIYSSCPKSNSHKVRGIKAIEMNYNQLVICGVWCVASSFPEQIKMLWNKIQPWHYIW